LSVPGSTLIYGRNENVLSHDGFLSNFTEKRRFRSISLRDTKVGEVWEKFEKGFVKYYMDGLPHKSGGRDRLGC